MNKRAVFYKYAGRRFLANLFSNLNEAMNFRILLLCFLYMISSTGGSDEYQSASIGGTANFVCNGECSSVSWYRSRPDNCPTSVKVFRGDTILCETIVLDQQFNITAISLNRCRLTLKKVTSADGGRYFCISKSGQFQGFALLLRDLNHRTDKHEPFASPTTAASDVSNAISPIYLVALSLAFIVGTVIILIPVAIVRARKSKRDSVCRQDVNVHVALSTDVTIEDKVFNRSTENKAIPVTDVHVSKNLSCSHVDNSDLIYEEVRKSGILSMEFNNLQDEMDYLKINDEETEQSGQQLSSEAIRNENEVSYLAMISIKPENPKFTRSTYASIDHTLKRSLPVPPRLKVPKS